MELGTGIFLSTLFLGTVALFIATKDRWNWKKIFLWPLGIIVSLAVISGVVIYFHQQYENQPKKLTELWGVSLKDGMSEVKFKKGEPTSRPDSDLWVYRPYQTIDGNYVVYFKDNRVRAIIYFGPMYNGPSIAGVSNYDSPQDLDKKLGSPSFVSRSKDDLRRSFSYEEFNIVAQFESGKMSALGIYDPTSGPFRFKEESQDSNLNN
jgi:hypothetical protein